MRLPEPLRRVLPALGLAYVLGACAYMSFRERDPDCPSPERIRGMDLVSYWVGGSILADGRGERLYLPEENRPRFKALYPKRPPHYPIGYPPPIYQLFAALQAFAYFPVVKAILFLVGTLHVVGAVACVDAVAALRPWRREALFVAFLLPGGVSAILTGQLGGVWTACLGAGLALRLGRRPVLGGLALAGLWLKPTLAAPVLVACLAVGEWRVAAGMLGGGAGVLALSLLGGGAEAWSAYLTKLAHPERYMDSFWIFWTRQVNLRSWLPKLMPDKVWSARVGWVSLAVAVGGLAYAAYVAAKVRRAPEPLTRFFAAAAVLSAALFAAPHLLDYDLGLHLPALAASGAWLLTRRARWPRAGWVLLALAWMAPWYVPLNRIVLLNLSVTAVGAWLVWMVAELRAADAQSIDPLRNAVATLK